jgi:small subunit ribosomal protein S17
MNATPQPKKRRELAGTIVSKSGKMTVAVEIVRVAAHPLYGKRIHRTQKYLAHDTTDALTVGEKVTIRETRPLSRRKRWIVVSPKTV